MKTNQFNITITPDMLHSMIRGMIAHEHGDIVADVIANHLDDFAVEQLYRAIHGIAPKVNVHIGQSCLIPVKRVCGWKYDIKDQTTNLIQDKYVSCVVIDVDPYRKYPVKVEYTMLDSTGMPTIENTAFAEEDLIIEKYD